MSRAQVRYRRNNLPLLPPTGNVFRIKVLGDLFLQNTQNVFYYMDTGTALTPTTESEVAHAFNVSCLSLMAACATTDMHYDSVSCEVATDMLRQPAFDAPTVAAGSVANPTAESFISCCIRKRTAVRSACGRGRVYLPGIPLSKITDNFLTPGFLAGPLTSLCSALNTVLNTFGGRTSFPCVFSKGSRLHKVTGAALTTSFTPDPLIATTRRRIVGRGK